MTYVLVVGEDALCCVLGERLVSYCLPGWRLAAPPIDTKGVTHLRKQLPRYAVFARSVYPVLCVADTDGGCALELVHAWLPQSVPRLVLRLAVPEAESWALADAAGFADALNVPATKVPREPDSVGDAKAAVLSLARRSRSREVRTEMVSALDSSRKGAGYNLHLCRFVRQGWRIEAAAERSPSLQRAVRRVLRLRAGA
jgi:hypothetical protein